MDRNHDQRAGSNTRSTNLLDGGKATQPAIQGRSHRTQHLQALGVMFLSAVCISLEPVFFVIGEANKSPVHFTAALTISIIVLTIILIGGLAGRQALLRVFNPVRSGFRRKSFLPWGVASVCKVERFLFAVALTATSAPVAFMLYEIWPVIMILLIACFKYFSNMKKENTEPVALLLAFVLCIAGVYILARNQSSKVDQPSEIDPPNWLLWLNDSSDIPLHLLGTTVAFLAGVCAGFYITYSRMLAKQMETSELEPPDNPDNRQSSDVFELTSLVYGTAPSTLFLSILAGVALWKSETSLWSVVFSASTFWAFVCAMFSVVGAWFFRKANNLAGYNVNLVYYLTPVLALGWLVLIELYSETPISVNRSTLAFVIIGIATIIAGNVLAVFSVDRSVAFKGLIFALWVFGGFVFLHDQPCYNLYYESVVAVVTVFVLLLSFRTDRLVRRIEQEEIDTVWLWRALERSVHRCLVTSVQQHLYTLIASRPRTDLRRLYQDTDEQNARNTAYELLQCSFLYKDQQSCDEIRARVATLAQSKQKGSNWSEFMAIGILGSMAIGGLVFFLPDGVMQDWRMGLFAELSAILLAASIVFLFFYSWDIQRDRWFPPIDSATMTLKFRDPDSRQTELIGGLVGAFVVCIAFAWVLYLYWQDTPNVKACSSAFPLVG